MTFSVGFTGTRFGMTKEQKVRMSSLVPRADFYHHGDCVGADADFHNIVRYLCHDFNHDGQIVGHLPVDTTHRAFCTFDETRDPLPHMKRNKAIVTESDVMLACPSTMEEQQFGGTWATIRMARKAKKPLTIVYPDGSVGT